MNLASRFRIARRRLVSGLEAFLILGMATLTFDVLWGVFSRYVLGSQSSWTDPLATTLLVWITMLGAALAYGDHSHLGVDWFVNQIHPDARIIARATTHSVIALFAIVVLVGGGCVLFTERLHSGQILQGLGFPRAYVYLATPVSGAFVALFAAENLFSLRRNESAVIDAVSEAP